jgi:hypothetical protein
VPFINPRFELHNGWWNGNCGLMNGTPTPVIGWRENSRSPVDSVPAKKWVAPLLEHCPALPELSLNIQSSFLSKSLGLSSQSLPPFDCSGVYPE